MGYVIDGVEYEYDDEKFLLEPIMTEEAAKVIAAAEGIELTPEHWMVIEYLWTKYKEEGHTPNFRNMVKDMDELQPGIDWKKRLYDLFPMQPARQAARVAGLTKPFGKGGY